MFTQNVVQSSVSCTEVIVGLLSPVLGMLKLELKPCLVRSLVLRDM